MKKFVHTLTHRWEWVLLFTFILLYTAVLSYYSILRHNAFFSGFDLANMDQTIWNTLHGHFFELSRGDTIRSRFSIHSDLILVLLTPLYIVRDDVRMLLVAQSLFLALGAIPAFLLAQKVLKNTVYSLVIAAVYLLSPGLQWTNMYDFHGVALAIPLLLSMFYAAYEKKWRWYGLFALLAIITKEQVSLIVAMMGVALFIFRKERRIGAITFIAGVVCFLTLVFVVIPHFRNYRPDPQHWAFRWYQFNDEVDGGAKIQFPTPLVVYERFFLASDAYSYYFNLLKPYAFFPLLGLPWILIASPDFAINMLSSHAQMRGVMQHYDSGIIPFLIIGTIFGLYYLQLGLSKTKQLRPYTSIVMAGAVGILLLVSIRVSWRNSPLPYNSNCWCIMYRVTEDEKAFEQLLQSLPKDSSITSSPEIRPHVTHRTRSYTLPSATASAEYIALIDQNRLVGDTNPKGFENQLIKSFQTSTNHTLIKHIGHFYLYKSF